MATELLLEMKRLKSARRKLPEYNTMDDAVRLLRNARKIIVLTGAGVRPRPWMQFHGRSGGSVAVGRRS